MRAAAPGLYNPAHSEGFPVALRFSRTPPHRRFEIGPQPDFVSCGPTCLQAVYRYYGDEVSLAEITAAVVPVETGGTLAVALGCHALRRGYDARIFTYNVILFDPSWFDPTGGVDVAERLRAQRQAKHDRKLHLATRLYLEFLELGRTFGGFLPFLIILEFFEIRRPAG